MTISTKFPALAICLIAASAAAQEHDESYHADYVFGTPQEPSEAWMLTRGGRLYDNWFATQGLIPPEATHPAWPSANNRTGDTTWRCKSCHGWDYLGVDGQYSSGSYETGIPGVMGYTGDAQALETMLRGGPHGYEEDMIPQDQIEYLAAFLAQGLMDMNSVIDPETGDVAGDPLHGANVFQTTCAACHGFDGRAINWGDPDDPAYVGTEANANPWEVLHKIRSGHPGVEMISLRAFDEQTAVDVLAYIRTLPEE